MSFKKKFYKDLLTLGSFSYLNQGINFLSTIIVSRFLVPEEYGLVALIAVFSGFVKMFTDSGLSYEIIRTDYRDTYYKSINNLSFYIGIIFFAIMIILAYPISYFYDDLSLFLPIVVMSFIFIPQNMITVPSAIISKNLKFKLRGIITLISTILTVVLTIIMAYSGASYWSLIIPQLISTVIVYFAFAKTSGFWVKIYSFKYTLIGFNHVKSLLGNMSGFNLINYWSRNADNLLIGKFYGPADLGVYNRAYRFITLSLSMLAGLFGTILMPSLKKLILEGKRLDDEYFSILGIISLMNYPIALLLIGIPNYLVFILWGENWMEVAEIIPYFGVLILTQTLMSTTGQVYVMLNKEKILFRIGAASAIFMISGIVIGALFSVVDVARFYSLTFCSIILPLNFYFGFYKAFKFPFRRITIYWVPKILLSILLLVTIWIQMDILKLVILGLYGMHLGVIQHKDVTKGYYILKKRIFKN